MNSPIRVLVVDDHFMARKGVCALLATEPNIEVVGEGNDGRTAVSEAARLQPDVIFMDLVMPDVDGVEATRQIAANHRRIRILVLTSFATDDKVFPAIKAGARGYLLKDTGPEELVQAIEQVHRGESSINPIIARKLMREFFQQPQRAKAAESLTKREVEVLGLVGKGWNNQKIANELVIAEPTVRTHVSNILSKLQLASRTQVAIYAMRKGMASAQYDDDDLK